jgi:hypothetical protein
MDSPMDKIDSKARCTNFARAYAGTAQNMCKPSCTPRR